MLAPWDQRRTLGTGPGIEYPELAAEVPPELAVAGGLSLALVLYDGNSRFQVPHRASRHAHEAMALALHRQPANPAQLSELST